jgi:peptide methionine sulfoxide reductase MsrA
LLAYRQVFWFRIFFATKKYYLCNKKYKMREIIDNVIYDDEFEPVEMVISQGEYKDVSSTHYAIQLEVDFDEEMEDILTKHDLEMSGYILESIVEVFLETENPTLLEAIIGQESEDATLVLYADTEENQRKIAEAVQKVCTTSSIFQKVVEENIEYLTEGLDDEELEDDE